MQRTAPLETAAYCIRFAEPGDRNDILAFIERHWSASHAFVKYPALFDYEHLVDGELRFVIAIDKQAQRVAGIQGYILSNAGPRPDVWGAIWKVADTRIPALGYRVHQYLKQAFEPGAYTGVGVSATTFGLHRKMGHEIGHLDHYYRLGSTAQFRIAAIDDPVREPLHDDTTRLDEYTSWQQLEAHFDPSLHAGRQPAKDAWYIERRYFAHPAYRYRVFGMVSDEQPRGLLVAREVRQNDATALRFVDVIGDAAALAGASHAIERLIVDGGHEYADFYCHGIDAGIMRNAGFSLKDPQGSDVIPNYFEPFVQKNVPLAYVTATPGIRICKADADQDRPNSLPAAKRT